MSIRQVIGNASSKKNARLTRPSARLNAISQYANLDLDPLFTLLSIKADPITIITEETRLLYERIGTSIGIS